MSSKQTKKERHTLGDLEYAGACGVDSGQLMITDPCYAITDSEVYKKIMDTTLSEKRIGDVVIHSKAGNCIALCTNTGDGMYPVFIERHKDGKQIKRVIIELDCWD